MLPAGIDDEIMLDDVIEQSDVAVRKQLPDAITERALDMRSVLDELRAACFHGKIAFLRKKIFCIDDTQEIVSTRIGIKLFIYRI